LAGRGV